jgi:uncharacterized protein YcaQ
MTTRMTLGQARRIALAAQGLSKERPTGRATARQVGRSAERLELLQIDSVNVLSRAHYLPLYSRLGDYDRGALDRLSSHRPRRLVEYWAHEASLVRPEHFADLRVWQQRKWMGSFSSDSGQLRRVADRVLETLESSRPLTARQVQLRLGHTEDLERDNWGWNWSAVKRALEVLFAAGEVGSAGRTPQFERRYAPIHKILPDGVPADPDPDPHEAMVRLVRAAARAHGIGSVRCFADYFRVPARPAVLAVESLVGLGELSPVEVDGWRGQQYVYAGAAAPRAARGRALLGPFDSMVFERRRLEDLFGFRYRIEIYTPEAKREYGYYVLPFLLGERMVARVDLKADRGAGVLRVRGSYGEEGAPPETAAELAQELGLMARWLGLDEVVVEPKGDLARELAQEAGCGVGGNLPRALIVSHVD